MTLLMLAHTHWNQDPTGFLMSEKMDGMRAFWDGGITRGHEKHTVPWANTTRPYDLSTGLWSRYGNPIYPPNWWLDGLPVHQPLDGELWVDNSFRQDILSILKRRKAARDWSPVRLFAFDCPTIAQVLEPRIINLPNHKADLTDTSHWQEYNIPKDMRVAPFPAYTMALDHLKSIHDPVSSTTWRVVEQTRCEGIRSLNLFHKEICDKGGEGVMLRYPRSRWEPRRTQNLLKMKLTEVATGTVIGYNSGKGKYRGMLGSLILKIPEGTLEISGFTDHERKLNGRKWAMDHPGERLPDHISPVKFPMNSEVTFRFRGRTKDGIPNEARYKR